MRASPRLIFSGFLFAFLGTSCAPESGSLDASGTEVAIIGTGSPVAYFLTFDSPRRFWELDDALVEIGSDLIEVNYIAGGINGGFTPQNFDRPVSELFAEEVGDEIESFQNHIPEDLEDGEYLADLFLEAATIVSMGDASVTRIVAGIESDENVLLESGAERVELILREDVQEREIDSEERSWYSESWAPYRVQTRVNDTSGVQQYIRFNNVSSFGSNSTYEAETHIWNWDWVQYGGSWATTMPSGYLDTNFADHQGDPNYPFNPTVGTSRAYQLRAYTTYYVYIRLSATTSYNFGGAVNIKGQKGHRTPSWCYWTWCIFADATTSSMDTYFAPTSTFRTAYY